MSVYLYIFGSVILVSLVSFAGLFAVSLRAERLGRMLSFMIPLAMGALFGDAFFHLIPESFEEAASPVLVSFLLILGIVSFFFLEKFLRWHHHSPPQAAASPEKGSKPLGNLILISDGLHNFIDGIIIGASYLVGLEVGLATTIAIILHEIPQEIGDFGVLLYSGYTRMKALYYNFLSALMAVAGAAAMVFLGSLPESLIQNVIPFAAGIFIYVAGSDLVPELHKSERVKTVFAEMAGLGLGILSMYLLLFLE